MAWAHAAQLLVQQRALRGCLVPTVADATAAAALALRERASEACGRRLFSAERDAALSGVHGNAVPEALILASVTKDVSAEYRAHYERAVRRILARAKFSGTVAWQIMIAAYWKYLRLSSGADVQVDMPPDHNRQCHTNILLFASTFEKRQAPTPFRHKPANAGHKALTADLRDATDAIEKYLYYMRPRDPMLASADTETRLRELLAYVATTYRWVLWFMDNLDAKVLQMLDKRPDDARPPRETRTPDELCGRYMTTGPGVRCGEGSALVLTALTANAMDALVKLGAMWVTAAWKSSSHGVAAAIVAAVELVTGVHHHLQYVVNMVLVGYVAWLREGLDDPYLRSALRAQRRCAHFIGKLIPTMSSHGWCVLDPGTRAWFRYAVFRSVSEHGGITPHYAHVLRTATADPSPSVSSHAPRATLDALALGGELYEEPPSPVPGSRRREPDPEEWGTYVTMDSLAACALAPASARAPALGDSEEPPPTPPPRDGPVRALWSDGAGRPAGRRPARRSSVAPAGLGEADYGYENGASG
ncbi:tegument protein VP11/12 [Beluga whale alphaherpesvirus 1]|uniref:Tegument protein UL46 homolog n=1 Tax=Beluga whale alphaherpesvirus 1 TaxID=1434720 RepID=A0A286RUG3_9ALPH|nr:tegument protein VP11/12 [Beluga whale alphaherpesvirus 1]ASW27061.1 tegument protein VP11/12 [Beluga whale alphaherpesvirus 1]